jgi:hypothetical protein
VEIVTDIAFDSVSDGRGRSQWKAKGSTGGIGSCSPLASKCGGDGCLDEAVLPGMLIDGLSGGWMGTHLVWLAAFVMKNYESVLAGSVLLAVLETIVDRDLVVTCRRD